jgi:2-oxoisovalerate dehydrogenase E1 component
MKNLDLIIDKGIEIRAFEKVILENFGTGKIRGTFHTSYGQELTSVIIAQLVDEQDYIFGTHRSHALYLALSNDFEGLASEVLGIENGTSGGIGGSQHLNFKNFYSNGVQGGMCALTVGASYDSKHIAICQIGDGTLGEGVLYESLNLSGILKSRTLYILEDNEVAQSTISKFQRSGTIPERFKAFGIGYDFVDSSEVDLLYESIKTSIAHVRQGKGPLVLHIKSYRLGPHSKGDDTRAKEIISEAYSKEALSTIMSNSDSLQVAFEFVVERFQKLIDSLLINPSSKAVAKDYASEVILSNQNVISSGRLGDISLRDLTYQGIKLAFDENQDLIMIGEDIEQNSPGTSKPYAGAFGVTKDLSNLFPGRILNSPISESGITGFAIGRALTGKSTIVEIMFGDFVTLAIDPLIQQASKIVSMYGRKVEISVLVRAPMGGRRGYGPTHSQNLEGFFFGVPNIIVYYQNIFSLPIHCLELIGIGLPIIYLEHKDLYNVKPKEIKFDFFNIASYENNNVILSSNLKSSGTVIITYGYALNLVLESSNVLAYEHEIFFNIIALQIISPLNLEFAKQHLKMARNVILVEECDAASGLAGLLTSELQKLNITATIKIISGQGIIGASVEAEEKALLSSEKIIKFLVGEG